MDDNPETNYMVEIMEGFFPLYYTNVVIESLNTTPKTLPEYRK